MDVPYRAAYVSVSDSVFLFQYPSLLKIFSINPFSHFLLHRDGRHVSPILSISESTFSPILWSWMSPEYKFAIVLLLSFHFSRCLSWIPPIAADISFILKLKPKSSCKYFSFRPWSLSIPHLLCILFVICHYHTTVTPHTVMFFEG
jgi:hypothetical protein